VWCGVLGGNPTSDAQRRGQIWSPKLEGYAKAGICRLRLTAREPAMAVDYIATADDGCDQLFDGHFSRTTFGARRIFRRVDGGDSERQSSNSTGSAPWCAGRSFAERLAGGGGVAYFSFELRWVEAV